METVGLTKQTTVKRISRKMVSMKAINWAILIVILLLLLLVIMGFSNQNEIATLADLTDTNTIKQKEGIPIENNILDSLVAIIIVSKQDGNTRNGVFTGVLITKNGHILTANHSFREERVGTIEKIWVKYGTKNYEAKIVRRDFDVNGSSFDLAVLKMEKIPENLSYIKLQDADKTALFKVVGFPNAEKNIFNYFDPEVDVKELAVLNEVTTIEEIKPDPLNPPEDHGYIFLPEVVPGFSGGPVFSSDNQNIIAIISAQTVTNKSKAHSINLFLDYLRGLNEE